MDEGDYGQEYQTRLNQDAVAGALRTGTQTGQSAFICAWCEEEIPEARRLAVPGCTLCVQCQTDKERLKERG